MTRINQHVLIIDNATTCSMRLKVLIQIHGVMASIVHWSDWEDDAPRFEQQPNCLVIIEETVPKLVVQSVASKLPDVPFFLLFNGKQSKPKWQIDKQVNPLSSTLSNFEVISLLEPYWVEEKAIHLPTTLILDSSADTSYQISQTLADANIPCQIVSEISTANMANVDLVLINVADYQQHVESLEKLFTSLPHVGGIAYGNQAQLTELPFVQFALRHNISEVITTEQLQDNWLNKFYRVWRKSAEQVDKELVGQHIQTSLDYLLEKNLVLKVLFETALDGVVSFDLQGQISRMNGGFVDLVGGTYDKLLGASLFKYLSHQSRIELRRVIENKQLIQQQVLDLQLAHEHNVLISVSASINKINFQGQSVFVAVMRNNTNQQLNTKLMVQKNLQLEHQARILVRKNKDLLDEKTRTERNKNAFMVEFSRYLSKNLQAENSASLQRKLQNIETYFNIESGQEPVNAKGLHLSNVLESVLVNMQQVINDASMTVKVSVLDFQQVKFNADHLERILQELLSNAIRFSPQGGRIEIKQFISSSQMVRIEIRDTGKGILDHKHNLLFDLYQTNISGSLDIHTGLPMVKKLLQLHQGDIRVENNEQDGKIVGASFILTLPLQ